jgi:hypothetical protein
MNITTKYNTLISENILMGKYNNKILYCKQINKQINKQM